jgi:hypothetical protein
MDPTDALLFLQYPIVVDDLPPFLSLQSWVEYLYSDTTAVRL